MSFCKVLPGSELLATITHKNKRKWPEWIYALPILAIKAGDPKENVLLQTRIRSCDIFKKSEFRKIWIALYLSTNVIINVKINGWTRLIFLTHTPWSQYLQVWRSGLACVRTTTLLGLFIHLMSKRFSSIKHPISQAVVILMWSRVIPSVQALTLSWVQDGGRVHVGTCAQMPLPALSWKTRVWCWWQEWGGTCARGTLSAWSWRE